MKLNFDREIRLRKDDEFGPNAVLPEIPEGASGQDGAPDAPEEELDE